MIIGIVVGVDTVILLIGTAIPETRFNATLVEDEEHLTSVDVSFSNEGSFKRIGIFHTRKPSFKKKNIQNSYNCFEFFS